MFHLQKLELILLWISVALNEDIQRKTVVIKDYPFFTKTKSAIPKVHVDCVPAVGFVWKRQEMVRAYAEATYYFKIKPIDICFQKLW